MKQKEIDKTHSAESVIDLIRKNSMTRNGICIVAINENPLIRESFYEKLKEGLDEGCNQGKSIRYREWDFSVTRKDRTIDSLLFPNSTLDKGRMENWNRDEIKKQLCGAVRILLNAQDLSLNSLGEKKLDMAILRDLISSHGLICVVLAPKSILSLIELDNDLNYYSSVGKIV